MDITDNKVEKRRVGSLLLSFPHLHYDASLIIQDERVDFVSTRSPRCNFAVYYSFFNCSCMAAAARRPSPMARITVAPPRTISPPAYMSGRSLCMVS